MTKLPSISGRDCSAALSEAGFYLKRQRGSHLILRWDAPFAQVSAPDHKELDRATLRAILRGAGLTPEEFAGLLGRLFARRAPRGVGMREPENGRHRGICREKAQHAAASRPPL